jgi:hypothetical protein
MPVSVSTHRTTIRRRSVRDSVVAPADQCVVGGPVIEIGLVDGRCDIEEHDSCSDLAGFEPLSSGKNR